MLTRRVFIKVGLGGAALFAIARHGAAAPGPPAASLRLLDEKTMGMVKALASVVLASALPDEAAARDHALSTVALSFDRAASSLAPVVQREITDLFSFLDFPPTRIAFARLWSPVGESTPDELRAFLSRWRESPFELQQASYQALTQLINASWYDMPQAWVAISYPGPPQPGTK
jgi:hypothetical protein